MRAATFVAILSAGTLWPAGTAAQVPDQPMLRWQYFYEQRAYPFNEVPSGALRRGWLQMRDRWPALLAGDATASILAATRNWLPIGPAPIAGGYSGRISTIAVHPSDSDILYLGGAQGGVWKSIDGGASWAPLTDRECSLAMGSIAIDPVNPQIVYAGTGEMHFSADSYYGCGVLRSVDGGATWTQYGGEIFDTNIGGARISKLIVDPPTAGSVSTTTVYAATTVGVYVSRDSGITWSRLLDGVATDLVMHPADPRILHAAIGLPGGTGAANNGVYRSDDGGATWTHQTTGFPGTNVGRIALAIAPSAPSVLYAAVQDQLSGGGGSDGRLLGIYKTTNGGSTWSRTTAAGADCASQCWYNLTIATDPRDPEIVYFGGVLLYRSDNGGAQFNNILRDIHVDQHAITFDPRNPDRLYVGNDGGIYRSTNGGVSWVSLNTNLALTQFYAGISLHPTDPGIALGGTQDNGTLEYGGVDTWSIVLGGDGGYTAIDYQNPLYNWAETQWSAGSGFSGPRLRVGPGQFGARKVNGIDLNDRAQFIPPLVMDPTTPTTLYFGTFRVYRTTDRGDFWQTISPDLSRGANGRITSIAPSRSDPATIWVGTNDGAVQVTRDGGATWNLRIDGLPNRVVTDIAVDATDPATAVITLSGFGTGHVFRTTNAGVSWTDISTNLPDVPVNAALTNPSLGSDIFIGTDLGVFQTTDGTTTWTPIVDGLPNSAVFDLAYNAQTGFVVAATHGRGMFSFRPQVIARLIVAPDSIRFNALADSIRLAVTAFDTLGTQLPDPQVAWRSLDATIATVDADGLVRSIANGETAVIASYAGAADTIPVRVDQVIVALVDVPASIALVVGEQRPVGGRAVDARNQTVTDATIVWSTSNAAAATVDAAGSITGVAVGNARVTAMVGTFTDSVAVTVAPPSTVSIAADRFAPGGPASSTADARLRLLTLRLDVDGIEPVEITRLGFDVTGNDNQASLQLIRDTDADGVIDPEDPLLAAFAVALQPGTARRVTLSPQGFSVTGNEQANLIVALRMSGGAPNGTVFQASYLPGETATIGVRSRATNRIVQPNEPVASGPVRSTLLGEGELLAFSENPVRSDRVIFNFAERPRRAALYTVNGRLVIDFTDRITDEGRFEWDLRNGEGNLVAPGVYLILFDVAGTRMRERLFVLRRDDDEHARAVQLHVPLH
jgi:photosystem II stability/assembly factor-like uncharacterized protein